MSDPLFSAMLRRKNHLFILLAAAIVAAVVLNFVLPKTYKVTNCIRLGRFMGVPLELPEFTNQRFKMVGFVSDAYDKAGITLDIPKDDLPRTVKVNIENDLNKTHGVDTLIFETRGETPEEARAMSAALSDHLIYIHGQKLEEARSIRDREIQAWDASIVQTKKEIDSLSDQLKGLDSKSLDQAAMFMMNAKLHERRNILFNMMQMRHNVTLKNGNPVESFNTEVASIVRTPEKPSFPKLSLLLPAFWVMAFMAWLAFCWLETALATLSPQEARA